MIDSRSSSSVRMTDKSVMDVMQDLWAARRLVMIGVAIFLTLAIGFLGFSTPYSKAEMLVMPANPMGEFLDAPMPMNEGTLSPQRQKEAVHDQAFLRFENSYSGVRVASILLQNKEIIAGLARDRVLVFGAGQKFDTPQELSAYIKKRVRIEPVSGTPLRRLMYLHPDPVFAARFLSHIYAVTDELIRAQTLKEVQARAAYLDQMIAQNSDADHRRVLTNILMAQERLRMLVSIDQSFSATIIEPPFSSPKPVWPDWKIVIPVFLILGVLCGFVVHGMLKKNEE